MYTVYRVQADELNGQFLEALKAQFKNKEIEITVCETAETDEDETAYLLRSPANRERLLQAMANVSNEQNLVTVKTNDFR